MIICYLCAQLLTKVDSCHDSTNSEQAHFGSRCSKNFRYFNDFRWLWECKIMYAAPFEPQYFKSDAPKKMYANFPAGIHSMYIGEVINAWKK